MQKSNKQDRSSACHARLREERKAAGLCIKCGEHPPKPGRLTCEKCNEKQAEYSRSYKARRGLGPGAITITCDWCGKEFKKLPCNIKPHNFCSRKCMNSFRSKTQNPTGYKSFMDYSNVSAHMTKLNHDLNQQRMTPEVREKLRMARLGTGEGKGYAKRYGKAEHRVVAEEILGRPLRKDEVVHHIDFDKRNNSPDNLLIFSSGSEHAKYHAMLKKEKAR